MMLPHAGVTRCLNDTLPVPVLMITTRLHCTISSLGMGVMDQSTGRLFITLRRVECYLIAFFPSSNRTATVL